MTLSATRTGEVPIELMHAGEEVFFVLVPVFVVLAVIDYVKRRRARSASDEQPDPHHGAGHHEDDQGDLGPRR